MRGASRTAAELNARPPAVRAACHTLGWLSVSLGVAGCVGASNPSLPVPDPDDTHYLLAGQPVTLVDARADGSAGGRPITRYFGEDVVMDLDGDGHADRVFLVTHEPGGSGTFFYLVAALARPGGAMGSHGVLIGDRIAPQSVAAAGAGRVVVNFADRLPGEPFSTAPSQARSLVLRFDAADLQFGELVPDMEGEADSARMTLTMKSWVWIAAAAPGAAAIDPSQVRGFELTFAGDGTFAASTDCNAVAGRVTVSGAALEFHDVQATRMHCEGSLEPQFLDLLEQVTGYYFTSRGELIMTAPQAPRLLTFR